MEKKQIDYQLSIEKLAENGVFAGYASVFNVTDNQKDMILSGAFARTLKNRENEIKLLWQHKADEPIGVFTKIKEDKKGLYVEGKLLLDIARAREAYALLKSGAIDGLSIGYNVAESEIDSKTGIRIIRDLDLWEISLVTFPANSHAGVTLVKNETPKTIREFEHFLRDAGFSRMEAKSIALSGFKSEPQREADGDDEFLQLESALQKAMRALS